MRLILKSTDQSLCEKAWSPHSHFSTSIFNCHELFRCHFQLAGILSNVSALQSHTGIFKQLTIKSLGPSTASTPRIMLPFSLERFLNGPLKQTRQGTIWWFDSAGYTISFINLFSRWTYLYSCWRWHHNVTSHILVDCSKSLLRAFSRGFEFPIEKR